MLDIFCILSLVIPFDLHIAEYVEVPEPLYINVLLLFAIIDHSFGYLMITQNPQKPKNIIEPKQVEIPAVVPQPVVEEPEEEPEILEMGSPTATMALLKLLKSFKHKDTKIMGFTVSPTVDKKSSLENIYIWKVIMFGFDTQSQLHKDLQQLKSFGKEPNIELEVRFSADYPHSPPFVRVLTPRFKFRTGHVTVGGSVCMEILTNTGWSPKNDIENVLVQVRTAFIDGGAQLDITKNNYQYTTWEAWDAFYRAARNHNWRITGITPEKFHFNKNDYRGY